MVVKSGPAGGRWSAHLRLLVAGGGAPCRLLEINERLVRIGRDPHAEVCLPHKTISRIHAVLEHQHGVWVLDDMQSTNGTLLNGRVTEMALVQPGHVLRIGAYRITVLAGERLLSDVPETELKQGTERAEVLEPDEFDQNERTVKVQEPL